MGGETHGMRNEIRVSKRTAFLERGDKAAMRLYPLFQSAPQSQGLRATIKK